MMIWLFKTSIGLWVIFSLSACSGFTSVEKSTRYSSQQTASSMASEPGSSKLPSSAYPSSDIKSTLYQQYANWKGTQHRLGGLNKSGIDCSGLVFKTYNEVFNVRVPRTTELQSEIGQEITRDELRAGDLVFFKTSWKGRHVGMYIEDGKFLHVSSKKGVKISKLSDYYWKDRYWQARRVL